ncbi:MAG: DUF6069 family protein [Candidatus Dormibacteria bacterium]
MSASLRRREGVLPLVPDGIAQALSIFAVDFEPQHDQPLARRVALATVVAVVGSLVANTILVGIGTTIFPATKGFAHFRISDYGTLTAIGVMLACMSWPVVTRISSVPQWLFLRTAMVVMLVLWLPDLWILLHGEPPAAVLVLMLMHLAVALITYPALVKLAPVGPKSEPAVGSSLPLWI